MTLFVMDEVSEREPVSIRRSALLVQVFELVVSLVCAGHAGGYDSHSGFSSHAGSH
ncbi:MAG: hypothetical protein LZF62_230039 [Nitrospira sp.]|nr:MAG: hypothetical protein LZF62_230039 [Nitrospira sp.]